MGLIKEDKKLWLVMKMLGKLKNWWESKTVWMGVALLCHGLYMGFKTGNWFGLPATEIIGALGMLGLRDAIGLKHAKK